MLSMQEQSEVGGGSGCAHKFTSGCTDLSGWVLWRSGRRRTQRNQRGLKRDLRRRHELVHSTHWAVDRGGNGAGAFGNHPERYRRMMTCDCSWFGCFVMWGGVVAFYAWLWNCRREAFWSCLFPWMCFATLMIVGLILKPFIT